MELCLEATQRNNSDAVLVSCLAALRKICSVTKLPPELSDNNQELKRLIEPKLMDSFLLCSRQQENFV